MKKLIKIMFVICVFTNLSCEDIPDFNQYEVKPVVEAFISEGEPVDDIYLKKTVPFNKESDTDSNFISDAIITINGNGQNYILSPVKDQPGRYLYDGNDFSVNVGEEYFLSFEYENRIISSTTTIPKKPEGIDLSPKSIYIPAINSLSDLRNFRETFQKTINITWDNSDGSYYYLLIENIENNPQSIDPTDVLGGLGINFEFTTSPTQENFIELRPLIHYTQYGTHKATIYHVNEEYALLYETSTQDSRDLNEPFTNINNGLGIFSGFSSREVFFEVIRQ